MINFCEVWQRLIKTTINLYYVGSWDNYLCSLMGVTIVSYSVGTIDNVPFQSLAKSYHCISYC